MWRNIVERRRAQMTIWRMHIVCWIPKVTNTHTEVFVLISFHCNNGCTNARECYVIRTLAVLFNSDCSSVVINSLICSLILYG
jgi:hypothetical protein